MNKYIDTDKLIALIDTKLDDLGMSGSVWVGRSVLNELKEDIKSLQQEQPEVDLEKEIAEWQGYEAFPEGTNITHLPKAMNIVEKTAKHFYELGLNARKK